MAREENSVFKYAIIKCLTHDETVWDIDHLFDMISGGWDIKPGIDGKMCDFLIEEAGVFVESLSSKELKTLLEKEKAWSRI